MVSIDNWWDSRVRGRSQAVLELVIQAIADDYETLEIIHQSINIGDHELSPEAWPARSAVPVSRHEIVKALGELTREGYAQSYCFGLGEANAVAVKFSKDGINDLWFYVTPKGENAVKRLFEQINERA